MSGKGLVALAAVTAAAVAVPVASAHTLPKAAAKREAAKVGTPLGESVGGAPVYQCARRSEHVVVCEISVVGADGAVCVTRVRMAYRDARERRIGRRVLSGPECTPPELPALL